jgi:glucokinase
VNFPYPVILCDVGGTNVRIAHAGEPDAPLEILGQVETAAFAGLAEAIEAVLPQHAIAPCSVLACAAGPVSGRQVQLTNAAWHIDGPAVAERLGLAQGLLLNDFEAQALALPALREAWLTPIGPLSSHSAGMTVGMPADVRIILGPGTGLGVAALLETGGHFTALASETPHIDFGPVTDEESALWPHLERPYGRVTAESVMSGPGLVRLHKARLMAAGRDVAALDAIALVERANQDPAGEEAGTMALFWRLIGRFAGDMALVFMARGGVVLGGGILPRILRLLDPQDFRAAFEAKAPLEAVVRAIPTELVTAPQAVLAGMAAIAAAPDRYRLDYARRKWR